jgi:hypothetical protein
MSYNAVAASSLPEAEGLSAVDPLQFLPTFRLTAASRGPTTRERGAQSWRNFWRRDHDYAPQQSSSADSWHHTLIRSLASRVAPTYFHLTGGARSSE